MPGHEARIDLTIAPQANVIEDPNLVAMVGEWDGVVHYENSVESALDLLCATDVWVVPKGAGVLRDEAIGEPAPGWDGGLGDAGHAVHGVGNAYAVPMDRGGLGKVVLQANLQLLSEAYTEHRAWHLAVVGPHGQQPAVELLNVRRGGTQLE